MRGQEAAVRDSIAMLIKGGLLSVDLEANETRYGLAGITAPARPRADFARRSAVPFARSRAPGGTARTAPKNEQGRILSRVRPMLSSFADAYC